MADHLADVVIVGSGIAASLCASVLVKKGIKVTIIEAGDLPNREQSVQKFYESVVKVPECPYVEQPSAPFPISGGTTYYIQKGKEDFQSAYLRVAGGTTWHWLGTFIRLIPEDFKLKTNHGVGVDWPIDYKDLEPWYARAEKEIGVSGHNGEDLGSPRTSNYPMPEIPHTLLDKYMMDGIKESKLHLNHTPQARNSVVYDSRPPCCGNASCVPICPIQAKYDATVHLKRAIAGGAKLITNAVACEVISNPDGKITEIKYKRPDKTLHSVKGKYFIIAAHAIETPKLLLMSTSEHFPNGIANKSDQMGRNLCDHPEAIVYGLTSKPIFPYRSALSTAGIDSTRSGDFRKERAAYRIEINNDGWNYPEGGFTPLLEKLTNEGLYGEDLQKKFKDIASRQLSMQCLTEMLPNPNNRILPSKEVFDAIGLPHPEIYFELDEYTKKGHEAGKKQLIELQKMAGCTSYIAPGWFGAGHIMGTYRMGSDSKTSVVDANSLCHDHKNLYLLGSGVFPSVGSGNPTLTIAALALRCGEHMVKTHFS